MLARNILIIFFIAVGIYIKTFRLVQLKNITRPFNQFTVLSNL